MTLTPIFLHPLMRTEPHFLSSRGDGSIYLIDCFDAKYMGFDPNLIGLPGFIAPIEHALLVAMVAHDLAVPLIGFGFPIPCNPFGQITRFPLVASLFSLNPAVNQVAHSITSQIFPTTSQNGTP